MLVRGLCQTNVPEAVGGLCRAANFLARCYPLALTVAIRGDGPYGIVIRGMVGDWSVTRWAECAQHYFRQSQQMDAATFGFGGGR